MSRKQLSMRKIGEVARLKASGLSVRQIARSCNVARSTVAEYLERLESSGLSWPYRVRYYVAAKLFRELTQAQAHADGSFMSLSTKLLRTDLLLIDDWGMETLKESQYRDLLELLDDRQGAGATLVTSQFATKLWHDSPSLRRLASRPRRSVTHFLKI